VLEVSASHRHEVLAGAWASSHRHQMMELGQAWRECQAEVHGFWWGEGFWWGIVNIDR
jgi:hypothetical protein